AGLDLLEAAQLRNLTAHVKQLTHVLLDGLRAMPHVRIYGPADGQQRGGTVAFNVTGVPFGDVESRAREHGVSVRGGCFCNPGASEAAFGLRDVAFCLDKLGSGFTPEGFAKCANTAVGAVRASIGLANNEDDVHRLLDVVASFHE
ncbi:MAG TPA: aminotransferase class V-fold PLP-dependent enzyme, partial [Thermoanaerobaculia bacterium]